MSVEQRRHLNLASTTGICIASMIGTGIFTVTGLIGPGLVTESNVIIAWVLGAVLALTGAMTVAELAGMAPHASGIYVFIHDTLGARTGYAYGMITALVGYIASASVIALATCAIIQELLPWADQRLTATVLLAVLTVIHASTVLTGARLNDLLILFKILIVVAFIAVGLTMSIDEVTVSPEIIAAAPSPFSGTMASAVIMVNFAFLGWSSAAEIGGEVLKPGRTLPRAIVGAVGIVLVLYLLINVAFMRVIPPSLMIDPETGAPMEDIGAVVAGVLFGSTGGTLVALAIIALMLSTLSTGMTVGGRVIAALAWKGELPAALGRLNATGAPSGAIITQGLVAILFIWSGSLAGLLQYTGLLVSIFAALMAWSVLWTRWRHPDRARPFTLPLFPLPPLVFLLLTLWLVVSSAIEDPLPALASGGTVIVLVVLRPMLATRS